MCGKCADPKRCKLYLGLSFSRSRFVDRHLDGLLIVGDHDGPQSGILCVHLGVVDGPEAVEHQVVLVPLGGVLHGQVRLVANDMIDYQSSSLGQICQQTVL